MDFALNYVHVISVPVFMNGLWQVLISRFLNEIHQVIINEQRG